jgi:hypothetical protein
MRRSILETSFRRAWRSGNGIAFRLSAAIRNCRQAEAPVADFLNFASPSQPNDHLGKAAAAIVLQAQFGGNLAKAHWQGGFG